MLDTNFWKKYFIEYDILNSLIPYDLLLNKICDKAEVKNGDLVLDVGSGTGNLSIKLDRLGAKVTSIDYSQEGLEIHKKKNIKANVLQHDIKNKLPFTDNYFDIVVSNNVLYTIPRELRGEIFGELYRVLKPNGVIVLSNLVLHFKPTIIYKYHIKKYYEKLGLVETFYHLFSMLLPTFKIFYYNYLISKENNIGSYDFFEPEEQYDCLVNAGFSLVEKTELHYAGQAVLNKAKK